MNTRSMVFFLLASERVWSTKVSQRPLQSSGSSTPIKTKTAALRMKMAKELGFIDPKVENGGI